MKRTRRLISILLAVLMLTAVSSTAVLATDETPEHLALGDSISTGYGLTSPATGGFAAIVAGEQGFTLDNRAVNGYTAADIYALLKDGALDAQIADAELITVTCGGNDMMALLYQAVADAYNAENDPDIAGEDILAVFAGTHPTIPQATLMNYAMTALTGFASTPEYAAGLLLYEENLTSVMEYLRAKNATAIIVMNTQYNPYDVLKDHALFGALYTEVEAGVVKLNEIIEENAESLGYLVAEVYDAFKAAGQNLCNVDVSSLFSPNLDFHPNAAGHRLIAKTVNETAFHEHSYSEANCKYPATCSGCGETTGTVNAENHTGNTEVRDAKAATVDEEGYTGDTYCRDCGVKVAAGEKIPRLDGTTTTETDAATTDEVTEGEVTTDEVTAGEVTTDEVTAGELTTEEITTDEATDPATDAVTTDPETGWETDGATDAPEKDGCGAVLGASTASLCLLLVPAALLLKKRED